jgi:hypothetical protein
LADKGDWNQVFYISACAMLLAAGGWLLFDASRPVVETVEEPRVSAGEQGARAP